MSGRILAKSLLPEPKTSLKFPIAALVLVTNQKFRGKKSLFPTLSQKAPVGLVLDLILLLKNIRIQDHIFIA